MNPYFGVTTGKNVEKLSTGSQARILVI